LTKSYVYEVIGDEWIDAFNEIKAYGEATSSVRTDEDTQCGFEERSLSVTMTCEPAWTAHASTRLSSGSAATTSYLWLGCT
jgi:hypothetical protein